MGILSVTGDAACALGSADRSRSARAGLASTALPSPTAGDANSTFLRDVLTGLGGEPKTLPCRWLYDSVGSELFEEITRLEEYYPSRAERAILARHGGEIAGFAGPGAVVLEYGAGAGVKSGLLLSALQAPRGYVPIDIAGDFLAATAKKIRCDFPDVQTTPVEADFTADFDLPGDVPEGRCVVFFPGSTIGNFSVAEATGLLVRMRRHVGPGGAALIGADLKKDLKTLVSAYDDSGGVTARFNLNMLARINRELGGDFRLEAFAHEARWNDEESAVEMHLVSRTAQVVRLGGHRFAFQGGESIHTESSRKHDCDSFVAMLEGTGWRVRGVWFDDRKRFAVFGLDAE